MKKNLTALPALLLALALTACGGAPAQPSAPASSGAASAEPVELYVFAAASLQETLDRLAALYHDAVPHVTVVPTYDSSGTLKTQIENGASCDLFLSASPKQMDALDGSLDGDAEKNPDGLDFLDSATRLDLLENKVVLAVPEGNPRGVESFDQLAELLDHGGVLLAMGNSDVPVGQYTQKIMAHYGLQEDVLEAMGALTYGSNVKEVTSQVAEGAVDCGVIYATDAFSAGLTVADRATAEMCGQVIYPAAVLKASAHPEEAGAFLDYLAGDEAMEVFASVGFSPAG